MSLPTYRAEQLAESSAPLWQSSTTHHPSTSERQSLESTSESLPGYPPASLSSPRVSGGKVDGGPQSGDALRRRLPGVGPAAGGNDLGKRCGNTIFTFMPRYPIKAEEESVYAPISVDKLQTSLLLQQGISFLATFSPERFEYFIPLAMEGTRVHNNDWVPVMDEAWEMFALDPPKRMKVQIIEEPTETEQRKTRETKNGLLICFGLLCFFLGLFGFLAWLLVNSPSPRH